MLQLALVVLQQRLQAEELPQDCPQNAWAQTEGSRACRSHRWPPRRTRVHPETVGK